MKRVTSILAIVFISFLFSQTPAIAQNYKFDQSKVDALAKELGISSESLSKQLNRFSAFPTLPKSFKINGKEVDLNSLIDESRVHNNEADNLSDKPSLKALTRPKKGHELAQILGCTQEQAVEIINKIPEGIPTYKTRFNGIEVDIVDFKEAAEELELGAIDLGLSVKWASCNLEASSPEQVGDFYAWGELKTKTKYTASSYNVHFKDNIKTLPLNYDVANQKLGGSWRMPTQEEFEELVENCTRKWTSYNGRRGMLFTSKKNGNSIFLPAVGNSSTYDKYEPEGYYWSSTPAELESNYVSGRENAYLFPSWVYRFRFGKSEINNNKSMTPENGLPVRPVCE